MEFNYDMLKEPSVAYHFVEEFMTAILNMDGAVEERLNEQWVIADNSWKYTLNPKFNRRKLFNYFYGLNFEETTIQTPKDTTTMPEKAIMVYNLSPYGDGADYSFVFYGEDIIKAFQNRLHKVAPWYALDPSAIFGFSNHLIGLFPKEADMVSEKINKDR